MLPTVVSGQTNILSYRHTDIDTDRPTQKSVLFTGYHISVIDFFVIWVVEYTIYLSGKANAYQCV